MNTRHKPTNIYIFLLFTIFTQNGFGQPNVTVWYGDTQTFGYKGNPQQWVNILGNVSDEDGVNNLSYSLNGGTSKSLKIGPDELRLQSNGDINIEIDTADLIDGTNTIEIIAQDALSETTIKTVTLEYQAGNIWTLPYTTDWSSLSNIEEVNQVANIVDGLWELTPDGIRTVVTGYDRLLVVGDKTWSSNMEVEVLVIIHSTLKGFGVGFALGWQGHTGDWWSPRIGWPLEAIGWVRHFDGSHYLTIRTYSSAPEGFLRISMDLGRKYILKIRSEEIDASNSRFQVKFWEDGTLEPTNFMLSAELPTREGSILMITHKADVTWGNMTISPLTTNQAVFDDKGGR